MKARNPIILTFIIAALLLTGCFGAPTLSPEDAQATIEVIVALTALAAESEAPPADTESAPTDAAATEPTPPPPTAAPTSGPVVVFQAAGSFSAAEMDQIYARVINPYIHYYADLAEHPPLVSMSIEKTDGIAGYPYAVNAIFETGINSGFLVSATGGVVDWWYPDCLLPCEFSAEFRAAYPEIIAIVEP